MRTLTLNQMEITSAGKANAYITGFCSGTSLVRLGAAYGLVLLTPVGGSILLGITAGCAAYGIYSWLS